MGWITRWLPQHLPPRDSGGVGDRGKSEELQKLKLVNAGPAAKFLESVAIRAAVGGPIILPQFRHFDWYPEHNFGGVRGPAMEKSNKNRELLKKLEEAVAIADELNDEIALALIERALRHACVISKRRQISL